ncbi:endo-1,4-beta-xylanase Y [Lachnospiraceae bacterium]|nr:endo-1,4-beta-xylanase Y [Lachnospiraceae bacterium]
MKVRWKKLLGSVLALALLIGVMLPCGKVEAAQETLLNTYGSLFGYSGTCINLSQLRDANTLSHVKTHYNSITLENEMKPDAMLGYSPKLITKEAAVNAGYYVPSSCTETYLPAINFDTLDEVLRICYENGLSVRAHTLVWHSQTPDWFFRVGYSKDYGYVSAAQMDIRMEYYIKSIMNHVYTSKYGRIVYAWDVVNEYLHAENSGWQAIYGNVTTSPAFVKRAFQYAYDCINYFGLTDSVSLLYNDYNTYMEVDDVIKMIRYINSDRKICNGVGMQSHLGTNFPSVEYYTTALQSFVNAGFEVQITELDVVNKGDADQANYMYDLMSNILKVKKNGGNITGITFWGISDDVTWIKGQKPLLFSTLGVAKNAYYRVMDAYRDAGYGGGNTGNQPTLQNGWYYIKNVHSQKYLQTAGNAGGNSVNVEIGTGSGVAGQKWYVTNLGDGYITLKNGYGYMLDVEYGANNDGTNIQTYSTNGADAQKFKLMGTTNAGAYGIATKVSGNAKALDVYNWGTSDGVNVCQWTYYGKENQMWVFEPCYN